jgi:hypothetical protein
VKTLKPARPARVGPVPRTVAVLAAVALALGAVSPAVATNGQPTRTVPVAGHIEDVAWQSQVPEFGFPYARDTFGGRCSPAANWVLSYEGTGTVSHLGSVVERGSHCTRIDFATLTGDVGEAQWFLEAANRDVLELSFSGTFAIDPARGEVVGLLDWWVVGGTGRFTQATGGGVARVTAPLVPIGTLSPEVIDFQGVITYAASDRAGG